MAAGVILLYMKADLLFRERIVYGDGAILEMTIWRLPAQVPPSQHFLKYSLFYGLPGERLVLYDNERGKGDHRHYGLREEKYHFVSVERLMSDFKSDVEKVRGEPI
jgi:hypothetical protein